MSEIADGVGTAATGALAAAAVERERQGGGAIGHDGSAICANCRATLTGPYCAACGQQGHVHRTAGAIVHDILHGAFHFEGRMWRTLPLLAFRPGQLTRRYIDGERVRFVSPMALFLFSVFLMFAVLPSVSSHWNMEAPGVGREDVRRDMAAERVKAEAELKTLDLDRARMLTAGRDTRAVDKKLEDARNRVAVFDTMAQGQLFPGLQQNTKVDTGSKWLDDKIRHAISNPELTLYKVKTSAYKYSWALIPISLPFIWLLFLFKRGVGLYDHAVFATYSLSFMSLLTVVLALLSLAPIATDLLWVAFMVVPPIHMYKQLKGGYRLGRFGAAWRTFMLLIFVTIAATFFGLFLLSLGMT